MTQLEEDTKAYYCVDFLGTKEVPACPTNG